MFSRKEQLAKKTGPDGVDRYHYLKQLINEFTTTRSFDSKRQVLANLANFAYDPINYEHMKQLHLCDLFLNQLSENPEELAHYALSGLCNICCDPEFAEYIITLNGIHLISQYMCHANEELAVNSLTTLYYLFESGNAIEVPNNIVENVNKYISSKKPRLRNIGQLFFDEYLDSQPLTKKSRLC